MNAENQQSSTDTSPQDHHRPRWQQFIFDDIFLILMLGLVVPTLFYLVWGLMDLASVPIYEP
jgi:hypothetical protein